jgi:anti-sigma regulatory factor (Ser/Thr protein kinase)
MKAIMNSRLDGVAEIANQVRDRCLMLGCMDGDAVELVIAEALNNTIIHAHSEMSRISIEIEVKRVADTIQITVQDRMNSFNEEILKRGFELDRDNKDLSENGRGLLIICSLVDQIEYQNGQLIMIFKL